VTPHTAATYLCAAGTESAARAGVTDAISATSTADEPTATETAIVRACMTSSFDRTIEPLRRRALGDH
jgi:hypothetical protein